MEIITHRDNGLFPDPPEISLQCSCPDWADMCKHVAAVLYGVGARLDKKPELLFVLRNVDHLELVEQAAAGQSLASAADSGSKTIADADLSDVFGIEIDGSQPSPVPSVVKGKVEDGKRKSKKATSRTKVTKKRVKAKRKARKD